jgi:hypothetical protein
MSFNPSPPNRPEPNRPETPNPRWVRRTLNEIDEIERRQSLSRFNPILPAFIALAFALLACVGAWFGWSDWSHPQRTPVPFAEAFSGFVPQWIVIFLLAYGYRVFLRDNSPADGVLICTRCFESAAHGSPEQCQCGGTREPLYFWRWQKDPKPTGQITRNA